VTLEDRISALIRREAGFVDNPADSGGPTKFGVTQRKLAEARRREVMVDEVRELTEAEARAIYRRDFEAAQIDIAPDECEELLLDIHANHGPGNFARILQRALGVTVDGAIGPKTRAALAAADGGRLYRDVVAERLEFTGRVITKNLKDDDHDGIPDNTEFAYGWLVRQAQFVRNLPVGRGA